MSNTFRMGFARINIDPPLGIAMRGYYKPRYASSILSSLYINAAAFSMQDAQTPEKRWDPDTGEYRETKRSGSNANAVVVLSVDNWPDSQRMRTVPRIYRTGDRTARGKHCAPLHTYAHWPVYRQRRQLPFCRSPEGRDRYISQLFAEPPARCGKNGSCGYDADENGRDHRASTRSCCVYSPI